MCIQILAIHGLKTTAHCIQFWYQATFGLYMDRHRYNLMSSRGGPGIGRFDEISFKLKCSVLRYYYTHTPHFETLSVTLI